MTVSKQDLIKQVAEVSGLTKKDAASALEATMASIKDNLTKGEKVQLMGFGTFETRERAARKGRNPQSGEEIEIAAATIPAFKPGKELKEAVN